ncbi:MAG: sporulation integral membrane protein YtvI [Clostridiales bacterium]
MDREKLIDIFLKVAIILIISVTIILVLSYILPAFTEIFKLLFVVLMPFILAWLIAILTKPIVDFLALRLHLPRSLAALTTMVLLICSVGGILTLIISRLVIELAKISANIPDLRITLEEIFNYLQLSFHRLNLSADNLAKIKEWLTAGSESMMGFLSHAFSNTIDFLQGTPGALIFLVVTLVAVFFWSRDLSVVENALLRFSPQAYRKKTQHIYQSFVKIISNYCGAQLLLIGISTLICVVTYTILGVDGAFTIGLLTGVCDILPVLGPGTVIIPWALWSLFQGDYFLGIGLAVLYIVMILARNILEPKLVADSLGLHPLATLASIFVGLKLFGILGLAIGPVLLAVAMAIWRSSREIIE